MYRSYPKILDEKLVYICVFVCVPGIHWLEKQGHNNSICNCKYILVLGTNVLYWRPESYRLLIAPNIFRCAWEDEVQLILIRWTVSSICNKKYAWDAHSFGNIDLKCLRWVANMDMSPYTSADGRSIGKINTLCVMLWSECCVHLVSTWIFNDQFIF